MKYSDSLLKVNVPMTQWDDIGIKDSTIFIVLSGSSNVVPVYRATSQFFFMTVQIFEERKILKKNIKDDNNLFAIWISYRNFYLGV